MNRYSWLLLLVKFIQIVLPHGVTVLGQKLRSKGEVDVLTSNVGSEAEGERQRKLL